MTAIGDIFKWQFALWKLHRRNKIILHGCEIRVFSVQGDFAGTIDALISIDNEKYLIDFKGINVPDFMRFTRRGIDPKHRLQIVGYGIIVNGSNLPYQVKYCLLVGESKGGPISGGNAIGLHEDCVEVNTYKAEVRRRLQLLRDYEKKSEIPPIECENIRQSQFTNCPYSKWCRQEVLKVQHEKVSDVDFKVARPNG